MCRLKPAPTLRSRPVPSRDGNTWAPTTVVISRHGFTAVESHSPGADIGSRGDSPQARNRPGLGGRMGAGRRESCCPQSGSILVARHSPRLVRQTSEASQDRAVEARNRPSRPRQTCARLTRTYSYALPRETAKSCGRRAAERKIRWADGAHACFCSQVATICEKSTNVSSLRSSLSSSQIRGRSSRNDSYLL
jgi:hypothetical protein